MKTKMFFYAVVLIGIFSVGGNIHAQYDSVACNDVCGSNQSCVLDTSDGLYYCTIGVTEYDSCNSCNSYQTCTVDIETGKYFCTDSTTNSSSNSSSSSSSSTTCASGFENVSGVCFPTGTSLPDPAGGVVSIISNVMYWILSIFGILAIIAFIISGIQYILSTGSEEMIDTAKRNMKWSIVGVGVALSGLIIIYAIDAMLRGSSNF
jgi:hypothetical protein